MDIGDGVATFYLVSDWKRAFVVFRVPTTTAFFPLLILVYPVLAYLTY